MVNYLYQLQYETEKMRYTWNKYKYNQVSYESVIQRIKNIISIAKIKGYIELENLSRYILTEYSDYKSVDHEINAMIDYLYYISYNVVFNNQDKNTSNEFIL